MRRGPPQLQNAGHGHDDDDEGARCGRDEKYDCRWGAPVKPQKIHRRMLNVLSDEDDQQDENESSNHHRSPTRADTRPKTAACLPWFLLVVGNANHGAILLAAGIGLATWGLIHRYEKSLALERVTRPWRTATKVLGGIGELARGCLLALFGVYFIEAAVTADPTRAKSVDQALRALVHLPFGALAIGAISLGLLFFGIFSFIDARLRRL